MVLEGLLLEWRNHRFEHTLGRHTRPRKKAFNTLQRGCNQISHWEAWLALQHLLDWSVVLSFAVTDFD